MSKASEWYERRDRPWWEPPSNSSRAKTCVQASVVLGGFVPVLGIWGGDRLDRGGSGFENPDVRLQPSDALALASWILDTFGDQPSAASAAKRASEASDG